MNKEMHVSGTYTLENKADSFTGVVTFEERENSIFYYWQLTTREGNTLGGKGFKVAYQRIPEGEDKFEFCKRHAIEAIRKYRIGRDRIIQELNVH